MNSTEAFAPGEPAWYDTLILGGGPAGLSAALVLGRACRRVALIDSGHQRNASAAAMHGFLGRDGSDPRALLEEGRHDLEQYKIELFRDRIEHVEFVSDYESAFPTSFRVCGGTGETWVGRKLLVATGMKDELPPLPQLLECFGLSVHHCPYCDGWEKRGAQLLAYGNDASKAAGMGLLLRGWSDQVTVLTNGEPLDAEYRQQLERLGIKLCEERIIRLVETAGVLHGVEVERAGLIAGEALFFNTEEYPQSLLARSLGVAFEPSGISQTNRRQKTNVPGVYMAGDAAGNIQLAIVAAGEGATAAVALNRELHEEDRQLGVGYPDATAQAVANWARESTEREKRSA